MSAQTVRNNALLPLIYLLSGCEAVSYGQTKQEFAEALFTPCAVLQDFIVTATTITNTFSEDPFAPFADISSNKPFFTYLNPEPIWVTYNRKIEEHINKADYTRKLFQDSQPYIASRMDRSLSEQTITAYNQAQDMTYSFSNCTLPPNTYSHESDRLKVLEMAKYTRELYKAAGDARKEYILKSEELGEEFDTDYAKQLRSNILKNRPNYIVMEISRIGINRDEKQAVLYSQSGTAGYYAVLELNDHKWKVVGRAGIWVR